MLDKVFYEDDDLVFIEEGREEAEEGEGGEDGHGVGGEGVCPRQCCVHFQTTIFQGVEYSRRNAQLGDLLDEVYTMQRSERFSHIPDMITQDFRSNMRSNTGAAFQGNKHLLVLGLVEDVGKAALAAVLMGKTHQNSSRN